jgi:hypothetical protein
MAQGKYESDSGTIHEINLSEERLAEAGTPPAGAIDSLINVKVSKTNREYGIRPRRVLLTRTIGTAPNQFTRRSTLPVLTPTAFALPAFAKGATITIGAIDWTVADKEGEDF